MRPGPVMRTWRRRGRRGVAAAEFALVAPVILLLLIGAYDIGNAVQECTRLAEAVHAGGQYAMSYPTALSTAAGCTSTSLSNPAEAGSAACAITQALPSAWTNVTTSISCTCWSAANGTSTVASCTSVASCPNTSTKRYVTLQATMPFSSLSPPAAYAFSLITSNTVSYIVRVQ